MFGKLGDDKGPRVPSSRPALVKSRKTVRETKRESEPKLEAELFLSAEEQKLLEEHRAKNRVVAYLPIKKSPP